MRAVKPGDILLTKDKKKLTGLLIPGELDHAALFVGDIQGYEVFEMTHEDFKKTWAFDVCKESDRVVVLRCTDFDPDYALKVCEKAWSMREAKYDLQFKLGVKALYCSELVYEADYERRLKVDLDDLVGLGRKYISPMGLFHARNVEVVYDSDLFK